MITLSPLKTISVNTPPIPSTAIYECPREDHAEPEGVPKQASKAPLRDGEITNKDTPSEGCNEQHGPHVPRVPRAQQVLRSQTEVF